METESDVNLFNALANREAPVQPTAQPGAQPTAQPGAQPTAQPGAVASFADAVKASRASEVSAAPSSSVQWAPPAVPGAPGLSSHEPRSPAVNHGAAGNGLAAPFGSAPAGGAPAGGAPGLAPAWEPQLTAEEEEAEKHAVLLDLERLRQGGARLTREWTMRDSLDDMQVEARRLTSTVDEANAINTMKDMMRLGFAGVEFLNSRVPMLELDGWADSVSKDLSKYDSAMGKLYRKYWQRSNASSPEAEILLGLGSSLVMHHAKNKFRKRAAARRAADPQAPPPVPFTGRAKPAVKPPVPRIDDDSDDEMPPPGGNITQIKIE